MELRALQVKDSQDSDTAKFRSTQKPEQRWLQRIAVGFLSAAILLPSLSGCRSTSQNGAIDAVTRPSSEVSPTNALIQVVAAENFWGSIAAQLGGDRVKVTSIITNPDTDPHDYEPKPSDARTVATARYVIFNGAGYDAWGQKLVEANPVDGRKVLTVSELVGKKAGDNPHFWYHPDYVLKVVDQVTADLKSLSPSDAAYFDQARSQFLAVKMKDYKNTIDTIKQKYANTPIGATESVFAYMVEPLGLKLLTQPTFMNAISEGEGPTAADKAAFDQQIQQKQIKVLVLNSQNSTPDTQAVQKKAQDAGIAIVPVTETLIPATANFQDWQTSQLKALEQALEKSASSK